MIKRIIFSIFLLFVFFINSSNSFSLNLQDVFKESYQYEKMSSYNDAIRVLLPLYKKEPRSYLINLRLGWLYYLSGKYRNSIEYYQKAKALNPKSIEVRLGLSLPLMAQKDWKHVEELMRQIIQEDPGNYYANLRLAIALRWQNKAFLAQKISQKMLLFYPTSLDFLLELGKDLYWEGKFKEAKKIFLQVLLLDPENVAAKEFLKNIK